MKSTDDSPTKAAVSPGGEQPPFSIPIDSHDNTAHQHTRIHQTITTISDFFRPRNRSPSTIPLPIITTTPLQVTTTKQPISSFFRPRTTRLPEPAPPIALLNTVNNIPHQIPAPPAPTMQQLAIPATLIPAQVITT